MTTRHTTRRVGAGAALLLGLGVAGIGLAAPASAAPVDLTYDCTYEVLNVGVVEGENAVQVALDVSLPEQAEEGQDITSDVTATVTIPEERRDSLYGLLGVRAVDGPNATDAAAEDGGLNSKQARNQAKFTLTGVGDPIPGLIGLEVPKTTVPDSGELVVEATGAVSSGVAGAPGEYTVEAGDFQAYIRGYGEDGGYKTNVTLDCTLTSDDATLGTVTVVEGDGEEPSGTGSSSSSSSSDTPSPTGSETTSAPTDSETTSSTTAPAPTTTGDDGGPGTPDDVDGPETPGTVQTDGTQSTAGGTNAAALGLGSILLAGAAAGSVIVVRRRGAASH